MPPALSTYALVSVEEAKAHLLTPGPGQDGFLEQAINRASDLIEAYLDRQIVTRGELTEYHSMATRGSPVYSENLYVLQWPILTVTSVHEDTAWPRTYAAGVLLVVGTGYELAKAKGLIRRLGSGGPTHWATGSRAIRVLYGAGVANTAAVPARIKAVAHRLVANIKGEMERKAHGILAQSDSLGNFTRFGPSTLTDDMKADLASERRMEMSWTGEAA